VFNSLLRKISIYITYFEGLITYLITYLEDTGIGYGFQSSFHALTAPACLGIFFDFKYTDKLAIGGIDKMSTGIGTVVSTRPAEVPVVLSLGVHHRRTTRKLGGASDLVH